MAIGDISAIEDGIDSIQISGIIRIHGYASITESGADFVNIFGKIIYEIRTPADLVTKVFKEVNIINTISTYQ